MTNELRKYFKETTKEQILKDWEATKEFDNAIEPQCAAGRDYSKCHIHADGVYGCLDCGNLKTEE